MLILQSCMPLGKDLSFLVSGVSKRNCLFSHSVFVNQNEICHIITHFQKAFEICEEQ